MNDKNNNDINNDLDENITKFFQSVDFDKWGLASTRLTQIKTLLDKILNENFNQEEKQSSRYKNLMEEVDFQFGKFLEDYREEKRKEDENLILLKEAQINKIIEEKNKLEKKASLISWRSLIIGASSIAFTKLLEFILELIANTGAGS